MRTCRQEQDGRTAGIVPCYCRRLVREDRSESNATHAAENFRQPEFSEGPGELVATSVSLHTVSYRVAYAWAYRTIPADRHSAAEH